MQMCKVFGKKARGSIYPPIDDARPVESGIEAVAPAAAEMRLHRDGAQTGINADEQKPRVVPEQVRQAPAAERIKRRPSKPHHSTLGSAAPGRQFRSLLCSQRKRLVVTYAPLSVLNIGPAPYRLVLSNAHQFLAERDPLAQQPQMRRRLLRPDYSFPRRFRSCCG
jgi:hypothetical protein